ncbi:MAG: hypothetical protein ACKVU1_06905 [bacterium]
MRRSIIFCTMCLLVALPVLALAQATDLDTWIDTDFDGLPDAGPSTAPAMVVNTVDSFAIYVDLTGFPVTNWTNFLYYWQLGPVNNVDESTNFWSNDTADVFVRYAVAGGSIFPEDNFTAPYTYGIGGSGFNVPTTGGASLLAVVSVKGVIPTSTRGAACIIPRIFEQDGNTNYCTFGAGANYGLFQAGVVTSGCFSILTVPSATEAASWGKVKGLFR